MPSTSAVNIVIFLILFHASALAAPWMMEENKPVPGEFIGMEKGCMVFEFENKTRGGLELSRLTPQSLDQLREWYLSKTSTAESLAPPQWFKQSGARGVAIEKKSNGPEKWIFETQNFIFQLDAPIDDSTFRGLATQAEAAFNRINTLPIRIPKAAEEKYRILIFKDQHAYIRAGGDIASAARFLGRRRDRRGIIIATFVSLGLEPGDGSHSVSRAEGSRILVHEIGHQLSAEYSDFLPNWLTEGFAEYAALVPYNRGSFESSPAQLVSAIKKRIAYYEKMDPDLFKLPQPGFPSEKKHSGSDIADWLLPLDELLGNKRLINDSLKSGDILTVHRAYLTSLLITHYFFHLEGDGQGRAIRALYEDVGDLHEFMMHRVPLVSRVTKPNSGEELNDIVDELMKDFFRNRNPKEIQDDMVARYAKLGIHLPFPN
ncbi:MAG: hypothetical protein ACSHX9_07670 [Luteolibacter sp.]